jgi:hypothetical protein
MLRFQGDPAKLLRDLADATARAREALRRSAQGGGDPELLKAVGELDAAQNAQAFKTEGDKSGSKWAPLTPGYAEHKRNAIAGRKSLVRSGIHKLSPLLKGRPTTMNILVWSGDLRKSLTAPSVEGRKASQGIVRQNGGAIEVGSRHPLAAYHQNGTRFMRARPSVRKSAAQVRQLQFAIARQMTILMARSAGLGTSLGRQLSREAGLMPKGDPRL